jgi:hypothetical protein
VHFAANGDPDLQVLEKLRVAAEDADQTIERSRAIIRETCEFLRVIDRWMNFWGDRGEQRHGDSRFPP